MNRRPHAVSLLQASQESPTLARLSELALDSVSRLKAIEPLLPAALRSAITAGPIEGSTWCLLVSSTAVAAKLRQLQPALLAQLRTRGWEVGAIRLKVHMPQKH